jgi:hypothetical protein
MESLGRLVFMFDLAVFCVVLVAIPCVLVALMLRSPSIHQ